VSNWLFEPKNKSLPFFQRPYAEEWLPCLSAPDCSPTHDWQHRCWRKAFTNWPAKAPKVIRKERISKPELNRPGARLYRRVLVSAGEANPGYNQSEPRLHMAQERSVRTGVREQRGQRKTRVCILPAIGVPHRMSNTRKKVPSPHGARPPRQGKNRRERMLASHQRAFVSYLQESDCWRGWRRHRTAAPKAVAKRGIWPCPLRVFGLEQIKKAGKRHSLMDRRLDPSVNFQWETNPYRRVVNGGRIRCLSRTPTIGNFWISILSQEHKRAGAFSADLLGLPRGVNSTGKIMLVGRHAQTKDKHMISDQDRWYFVSGPGRCPTESNWFCGALLLR